VGGGNRGDVCRTTNISTSKIKNWSNKGAQSGTNTSGFTETFVSKKQRGEGYWQEKSDRGCKGGTVHSGVQGVSSVTKGGGEKQERGGTDFR